MLHSSWRSGVQKEEHMDIYFAVGKSAFREDYSNLSCNQEPSNLPKLGIIAPSDFEPKTSAIPPL